MLRLLRYVFLATSLPFMVNMAEAGELTPAPYHDGQAADLFGAQERLIGPTAEHLAPERLKRLASSGPIGDAAAIKKWSIITHLIRWQSPANKLKLVQQFFNTMPYESDARLYQATDYWASVGEFLSRGGDCEDFVIAKYRALVEGGFPADSLRLVLLEDRIARSAHAVLAAYVNGRIYILDNQRAEVVEHSTISHYRPLYSLNDRFIWRHNTTDGDMPLADLAIATKDK